MKNKKTVSIAGTVIVFVVVIVLAIFAIMDRDSRVTNDSAEKDVSGRYITIINNTDQIINEVHITIGNGTEIEEMEQTNPDETSFSIKIPKQYSEYKTFTVTLIDRYNMKYLKEVEVAEKGRTEVIINNDDYIKQKDDFWKKIDKLFNGD